MVTELLIDSLGLKVEFAPCIMLTNCVTPVELTEKYQVILYTKKLKQSYQQQHHAGEIKTIPDQGFFL